MLMRPTDAGWTLPALSLDGRHLPFSVAHIREGARREFGIDATVLRCLHARTRESALTVDAVYSLEATGSVLNVPEGWGWVGREELEWLEMAVPE